MIRTIIVDDEILSRNGIRSLIDGREDISVSEVFESAPDAIAWLRESPVDIVITDIEMSEMSGLEFIKILREENLTDGVIILSCHDDFSYAQEAIANGTDGYLLKHSVTEEMLIGEIRRVYARTAQTNRRRPQNAPAAQRQVFEEEDAQYILGVVRFQNQDGAEAANDSMTDVTMLVHLMEDIVDRGRMGTLFAPYDKETFIVFRYDLGMSEEDVRERLQSNIAVINRNIYQYFNGKVTYGISAIFTELRDMREHYEEAVQALQQAFYGGDACVFTYRPAAEEMTAPAFHTERFLERDGMERFTGELETYLNKAQFYRADVGRVKDALTHACLILRYQIIRENHLEEQLGNGAGNSQGRWQENPRGNDQANPGGGRHAEIALIAAISDARSCQRLRDAIVENIAAFRQDVLARMENDDLAAAFCHIEQHLGDKISLTELSEMSCMSVPTFSKRFKERTGMTLVQYLNEQRIERAKVLLRNQNYSLWQIAEMTGFSNTNYLVRVFKKVTDQTISDYRRQYGIVEDGQAAGDSQTL